MINGYVERHYRWLVFVVLYNEIFKVIIKDPFHYSRIHECQYHHNMQLICLSVYSVNDRLVLCINTCSLHEVCDMYLGDHYMVIVLVRLRCLIDMKTLPQWQGLSYCDGLVMVLEQDLDLTSWKPS